MKKKQVVKLPEYHGDSGPEVLLNFYRDLGWDEVQVIEPTKIRMNKEDSHEMIDAMCNASEQPDKLSVMMLWVNSGPGNDEHRVERGTVLLEEGWLHPEVKEAAV